MTSCTISRRKPPTPPEARQVSWTPEEHSHIRGYSHSYNSSPKFGWHPPAGPKAIQAIKSTTPNLGENPPLNHGPFQQEDQRENRNQGRKCSFNKEKPRNWHLDFYNHSKSWCLNGTDITQSTRVRVICHVQILAIPLWQALNIPVQLEQKKTILKPNL